MPGQAAAGAHGVAPKVRSGDALPAWKPLQTPSGGASPSLSANQAPRVRAACGAQRGSSGPCTRSRARSPRHDRRAVRAAALPARRAGRPGRVGVCVGGGKPELTLGGLGPHPTRARRRHWQHLTIDAHAQRNTLRAVEVHPEDARVEVSAAAASPGPRSHVYRPPSLGQIGVAADKGEHTPCPRSAVVSAGDAIKGSVPGANPPLKPGSATLADRPRGRTTRRRPAAPCCRFGVRGRERLPTRP